MNVVQQTIVAHWFSGKHLATAMAVVLTMNRLGATIGQAVVVPASVGRHYSFGSWITAGVSGLSFLANLYYVMLLNRNVRSSTSVSLSDRKKKTFSPRSMLNFSGTFWLIMWIHFFASGVMNSWMGVSSDFIRIRDRADLVSAVYKGVISLAVTTGVYMVMGPLVDYFGHRITFSLISNVLLVIFFALMEWTNVSSLGLMIMFAFTIPFKAVASLVAVPILVPYTQIGTAFAIYRCCNGIATTLTDTVIGVTQDAHQGRYSEVMWIFLIMSCLALYSNVAWWWIDRTRHEGLLQKTKNEVEPFLNAKKARELELELKGETPSASKPIPWMNKIYVGKILIALNVAWIFFVITSVLGSKKAKKK